MSDTWVALRNPQGELALCLQVDTDEIEMMAIQAGLQGLSLEEWMLTVLQASLDENPEERVTAEELMDEWIELSIDPATWEALKAHSRYWNDDDNEFAQHACCMLFATTYPGLVMLTHRLAGKGLSPRGVAAALLEEFHRRMATECRLVDKMEEMEEHDFALCRKVGVYAQALAAAQSTG